MLRDRWFRCGMILLALAFGEAILFGQTPNDTDLAKRTNELLVTYATFKQYASRDPAKVYGNLTADRKVVFDGIVRALFMPIRDRRGAAGKRVIDYIEEVRGIWGVRNNQSEGRYLFRMSLRFHPDLASVLQSSSNLPPADGGHVLLPLAKDGDDNPNFTNFRPLLKEGRDVITFREPGIPSLQVSMLVNDHQSGEADIDLDRATVWPPCGCHCQPSNSDVGSFKKSSKTDIHLTLFNDHAPYFSDKLRTTWSKPEAHCEETY